MKGNKDILAVFLIISIVVFSSLPLFKNINNINLDWDFLENLSFFRLMRQSILEYHQYPLRTPYFSGGYPLIGHPSSKAFFISFLFVNPLIFGEVIGSKINSFLVFLIGVLGMYYLTRYILKYNRLGALFSSLTFCLGSNLYEVFMSRGVLFHKGYCFLPISLAFFIKSKEDKRYLFFTAFTLTFFILSVGLQFTTILLFLFLFACLEFKRIYIRNFLIIILFTFVLGSVKIVPMLELLQGSRYSVDFYKLFGEPLLSNSALLNRVHGIYNLLLTRQSFPLDIAIKGYFPLEFYLGYIPVSLFIFASLFYWKKQLKWTALFVIFTLLSFGTNTPLDLFRLLHKLPIFNAMYKPAKYFVPILTFIITLGSGRPFLILERFKKRKLLTLIFLPLLIITVLDLYWANRPRQDIYPEKVSQYKRQESFFQVKNLMPNDRLSLQGLPRIPTEHSWELTRPTQYELLLQNIGKVNAYTKIHLGEYATPKYYIEWNRLESLDPKNYTWHPNPDYKGEIYFLNHPQNKAEFQYFSPNKLIAKVSVHQPDTLIINQNYDKYWRSDLVKPSSHNGLLAINLDKRGEYLIKFNYVPISFYAGLGVSLATLVFMIYYLIKKC